MQCYEIREDNGAFAVVDAYTGEAICDAEIRLTGLDLLAAVRAIDQLYEVSFMRSGAQGAAFADAA